MGAVDRRKLRTVLYRTMSTFILNTGKCVWNYHIHIVNTDDVKYKFFLNKLFISNQNYIRFYKLICCDSV
jgi:hypothetical protein